MRTFQYSDAKSHKFWNIDVSGSSVTVAFGKVGTTGQIQLKSFATPAAAQIAATKLIKEKTGKGYVETSPSAIVSDAEALERGVRANPHDLAAWGAFADYLAERGDPRGEFMLVQLALEDESKSAADRKKLKKEEDALLKKHGAEWLGDWPDFFEEPTDTEGRGQVNHTGGRKYEFRRGVPAAAYFGMLTVGAARAFARDPQTRFVQELFIGGCDYEDEFEPGPDIPEDVDPIDDLPLHVLLRWPHMTGVREFQFGWMADEEYGDFCHFQCHQSGELVYEFARRMPEIEELRVFAHFRDGDRLFGLKMPNLRVLQVYHGWSYPLDRLARNASLGSLTHLLCHPHALDAQEAYIRLPHLQAVCRSPYLQSLTHLRLRLTDFGDHGAREIVESGILKRLKALDLRHGSMTDEGAAVLAACPDLKHLEFLDLSRNELTVAGEGLLRATGVPADVGFQRAARPDADEYERNQYLYEGDYE